MRSGFVVGRRRYGLELVVAFSLIGLGPSKAEILVRIDPFCAECRHANVNWDDGLHPVS